MMDDSRPVGTTVSDDVLHLLLRRPDALNALDDELGAALHHALTHEVESSGARAVTIRGEGGHLMAGADLGRLTGWMARPGPEIESVVRTGFQPSLLGEVPVPVVVVVDGAAMGVGMDLALAADLLVVTERAVFAMPESDIGLTPLCGSTELLARRIGPARARQVLMLGRKVSAQDAVDWGLSDRVVASADLEQHLAGVLGRLTRRSRSAMAATKRLLVAAEAASEHTLAAEAAAFAAACAEPDAAEGVASLRERRRPDFGSAGADA